MTEEMTKPDFIQSIIADIDDQLRNPIIVQEAKGWTPKQTAQWMLSARSARQYFVESLVTARFSETLMRQEMQAVQKENHELRRRLKEYNDAKLRLGNRTYVNRFSEIHHLLDSMKRHVGVCAECEEIGIYGNDKVSHCLAHQQPNEIKRKIADFYIRLLNVVTDMAEE